MMYSNLSKGYPTFTHFPAEDQEMWFRQFAQEFTWNPDHTNFIHDAFVHKVVGVKIGHDGINVQIPEEEKRRKIIRQIFFRNRFFFTKNLYGRNANHRTRAREGSLRSDQTHAPLGRYVATGAQSLCSDQTPIPLVRYVATELEQKLGRYVRSVATANFGSHKSYGQLWEADLRVEAEVAHQPGRDESYLCDPLHQPQERSWREGHAEENDGEPVDDFVLMKTAHTNKHTGEIDDGVVRDVLSLIKTQKEDEETRLSQLQTDLYATSTASTNLSRIRINEIVESSVPKKKGRLVGLGRRARSVPPSAPQPYVDPELLMDQLKEKDDRIAALEQKMADQEAGWEATRKQNEQMMEMMKRMYPNEQFP
uniref:Uncharacterized protein n=1 Tax=Brassica oleracea var. oleracea TaxID=109376 RepID=A0A0D3E8H5_BRAOL